MSGHRPFRFGVGGGLAPTKQAWVDAARKAEALGFDVFRVSDHLARNLAPIPALLAVAMSTTTIRITTEVLDNDFRHPVLLANEVATLDLLSEGRVEVGIGAGWWKQEYDAAGMIFDAPGVRIDRMIEAVAIMKALWRGDEVHHTGTHYTITGLVDPVRPVQQPHPPILIGGGGKRLLSFAAQEADIIGLLAKASRDGGLELGGDETDDALARKVDWIRGAAGERLDQVELKLLLWNVVVSDNRRAAADEVATMFPATLGGLTPEQILSSPYYLIGSAAAMVDRLLELRERFGISYYSLDMEDAEAFAPVIERLKGQ
jgi:probable F420-dependent oxidoreductase